MADVFISYAHKDRAKLEKIINALDALDISHFVDVSLATGTVFDEVISSQLQEAKSVLVCWTQAALESKWVRAEASYALDRSKLVAVFLERVDLIPPFNLVQAADLIHWEGDLSDAQFGAILRRIGDLCKRPNLPETATKLQNKIKDLEPAVISLLGPLLAKWLDNNLPLIVERLVQRELERISSKIDR